MSAGRGAVWASLLAPLLAVLLAWPAPLRAAPPARRPSAQQLYQRGKAAFEAGRPEEALAAFEAAHARSRRPELLLNIGQCHRALGRRAEAALAFERFLSSAPDHRLAPATRETLQELRREQEREASAAVPAPAPSTDAPRAGAPALVPAPEASTAAAVPQAPMAATSTAASREEGARTWLWFALGGLVLAGGGAALFFATRPDAAPEPLGTLRLPAGD